MLPFPSPDQSSSATPQVMLATAMKVLSLPSRALVEKIVIRSA